ncbi:hypothetical protein K492DRAFT_210976 [Lichtheimia hyalospora FSU 10163]|nr:hypothetical protein K492DRAFT_210976 [Lichtheimia hyalospora FSU 10163]
MDRSPQNNLYAGLLIYRLQRNVEYLLLNDSFTNKKHWFCPKGQVIGQEDEVKCALREAFETTGLSPKDLRIEEGFTIGLTYLSGTRPKKVVYRLAQILDNHARVLPNADGVHIQWCNLTTASEKVIFKSMQEVFKHAQHFIESKKQRYQSRRHDHDHHQRIDSRLNNNAGSQRNILQSRGLLSPQRRSLHQHQTTATTTMSAAESTTSANINGGNQATHATENPWYKTRLCERFETEGSCSYGSKCTFAHGVAELRERTGNEEDPVTKSGATTNDKNPLYKTKLCERFMKDNFCQYGPKCHFAHGHDELKERPTSNNNGSRRTEDSTSRPSQHQQQQKHYQYQQQQQLGHTETSAAGGIRRARHSSPAGASFSLEELKPVISQKEDKHPRPRTLSVEQKPATPLQDLMNGRISQTNKSWMKIVHLSKEEQARITPPSSNSPSSTPVKSAQEEALIDDLKKLFTQQEMDQQDKQSSDVKEVTKLEMRNDLSKRQLLYILLASLLQDNPSGVGYTLKSRISLFKTFVKTTTDQRTLLKAWEKFVTQRAPHMISKTAIALSTWYDCDLVDEEVYLGWYEILPEGSELKNKSTKFIEWLSTADEEDNS